VATIKVQYSCGCNFKSENELDAVIHSDTKHHSMDIAGRITKDEQEEVKNVHSSEERKNLR